MGGLLKVMPWTGVAFLVAVLSLSAIPPLNGFASEWLTFQTALQAWVLDNGLLRLMIPIVAAVLALTGALAATCFVRAYGIGFLGVARSKNARKAKEVGLGMRAGVSLLAILCVLSGVFPTNIVQLLNPVSQQLTGQALSQATAHGWLWLTPLSTHTASYSAPLLLFAMVVVGLVLGWLLHRGKYSIKKSCEIWDCGFSAPNARMQYTATAFAQPFKRIFSLIYLKQEQVLEDEQGNKRYQLQIKDRSLGWFYDPVARFVFSGGRLIGRLQSGNVRLYLSWSLATLVVLLWIIS